MAALGIHGNGDGKIVTEEDIEDTLNVLDSPLQRVGSVPACIVISLPSKLAWAGISVRSWWLLKAFLANFNRNVVSMGKHVENVCIMK